MSLFSSILKYIWPQMRKYKFAFFLILFIFALRTVLDAVVRPFLFKKIIDSISLSGVDRISLTEPITNLVIMIISVGFSLLIIGRLSKYMHLSFEINMISDLRNFAFKKIQGHSQTFFSNTFSGSLVTKSRRFVGSFESMYDIFIYEFWSVFIALISIFVVMYHQSVFLTYIFLVFIVVFVSLVSFFVGKKVKYDLEEAQADSKIGGRLADIFGNILAVKIFSSGKSEIKAFGEIVENAALKSRKAWFFGNRIDALQGTLVFITQSSILYFMIKFWLAGEISTGTVVLIQTYMVIIFDRLWNLGNALTKFMKYSADMKEMVDIFEVIQDVTDPVIPEKLKMKKGHLVFNDVSFKYKNNEEIFNNFNLDIKPGERIGLVGHSGAGKSTFVNLILRFSDVNSGSITIDGQDVRNVTQDDLRSAISYVPQESVLFHRTIRENISYGKQDATDKEIISAAKKARAHGFVEKLPNKYETYVGERGVKLSGGERQRVAIARAILKNSPIFILDEATSALDSISEQYIQDAFNEIMKNKTTIVIAHRLSTIQKMDRIIVLEDGKIVEEGTHAELLEKGGQYSDLWNHQVGGFIE
ncbi:MAG: ABC transporter ATP-binding protein [Candidatus Paceibacterota bacterium]